MFTLFSELTYLFVSPQKGRSDSRKWDKKALTKEFLFEMLEDFSKLSQNNEWIDEADSHHGGGRAQSEYRNTR